MPACWALLAVLARSEEAPLKLVVSADLSRLYSRWSLKPKTALAVAYLLHEPLVDVLAIATGFGHRGWLGAHPCEAAETLVSELGLAVPVVCASSGFLEREKFDAQLARLLKGGAHWLALDSWAAAAQVTLPSMQCRGEIRSFTLPAPGLLHRPRPMPRSLDEQSSSSGLLLRSWQDGLPSGPPRLRLVGLTKAWRKDRMPRACAGSWMARFETGVVMDVFRQHGLRMARSVPLGSIRNLLEGAVEMIMPQDDHALLMAAVAATGNFSRCSLLHATVTDDREALLEECHTARAEDPPESFYAQVNLIYDARLEPKKPCRHEK